jgi:hypothetical protein
VAVRVSRAKLTPKQAIALLERNTHNRGISWRRVEQYEQDMAAGDWVFNGEAIKVAEDGTVLDGQHRLHALASMDAPIDTLYITGLPNQAQESLDQGKARGFHDVLKLRGEPNPAVLARAVRIVANYDQTGCAYPGGGRLAGPSNHVCSKTLEEHPEIRESVKFAARIRKPWIQVSLVAALHHLFGAANPSDATEFFECLSSGAGLDENSPIFVLRERLIKEYTQPGEQQVSMRVKTAYVVKAWNAYMQGEPLTVLRWAPGGARPEPFPSIFGVARELEPA